MKDQGHYWFRQCLREPPFPALLESQTKPTQTRTNFRMCPEASTILWETPEDDPLLHDKMENRIYADYVILILAFIEKLYWGVQKIIRVNLGCKKFVRPYIPFSENFISLLSTSTTRLF